MAAGETKLSPELERTTKRFIVRKGWNAKTRFTKLLQLQIERRRAEFDSEDSKGAESNVDSGIFDSSTNGACDVSDVNEVRGHSSFNDGLTDPAIHVADAHERTLERFRGPSAKSSPQGETDLAEVTVTKRITTVNFQNGRDGHQRPHLTSDVRRKTVQCNLRKLKAANLSCGDSTAEININTTKVSTQGFNGKRPSPSPQTTPIEQSLQVAPLKPKVGGEEQPRNQKLSIIYKRLQDKLNQALVRVSDGTVPPTSPTLPTSPGAHNTIVASSVKGQLSDGSDVDGNPDSEWKIRRKVERHYSLDNSKCSAKMLELSKFRLDGRQIERTSVKRESFSSTSPRRVKLNSSPPKNALQIAESTDNTSVKSHRQGNERQTSTTATSTKFVMPSGEVLVDRTVKKISNGTSSSVDALPSPRLHPSLTPLMTGEQLVMSEDIQEKLHGFVSALGETNMFLDSVTYNSSRLEQTANDDDETGSSAVHGVSASSLRMSAHEEAADDRADEQSPGSRIQMADLPGKLRNLSANKFVWTWLTAAVGGYLLTRQDNVDNIMRLSEDILDHLIEHADVTHFGLPTM